LVNNILAKWLLPVVIGYEEGSLLNMAGKLLKQKAKVIVQININQTFV